MMTLHRKALDAIEAEIQNDPERPTRQQVIRRILEDWFAQKGVDIAE